MAKSDKKKPTADLSPNRMIVMNDNDTADIRFKDDGSVSIKGEYDEGYNSTDFNAPGALLLARLIAENQGYRIEKDD